MPIDKDFRETWDKTSQSRPYQIWTSQHDGGQIHGSVVGVYIDGCIGCMKCLDACPTDALMFTETKELKDMTKEKRKGVLLRSFAKEDKTGKEIISLDFTAR